MNVENRDDDELSTGGSLKARHLLLIGLAAVVVGVVVAYFVQRSRQVGDGPIVPDRVVEVPEGTRAVTLYFAHRENQTLVTETRLVAIGKEHVDQIRQVVKALLEGPEYNGVSTIAQGTRLLGAFYDSDTSTLYIDVSSELVSGHPGGSSAEYYTIAAIVRTVSENFPEVRAVQVLIEGLQIGTIAGHIDAYNPFRVSEWR